MEELTYDDLLNLYAASTSSCDNCTDINCDECSLCKLQNKTRTILEKNGFDVSML